MTSFSRATRACLLIGWAILVLPAPPARATPLPRKRKLAHDLAEVLSHMNESSKHLKTLSANLEYTNVTVLVNDKSTQEGRIYYRKSKGTELRIDFEKPDSQTILFKKNKAEIYLPKINQIQEYNLEQRSELIQQFLLLGFGTETGELRKAYDLKLLSEEDIEGETTALLELIPRVSSVAAQLTKIQVWVSEESWLPVQQQFFEPGGNYLLARYTAVKVNMSVPSSTFEIHPALGASRVKMN